LIAGCLERADQSDGLSLEDAVRAMMSESSTGADRKPA